MCIYIYIYTYIIGMYVVKFKNGVRADIWVQFQYVRIDILTSFISAMFNNFLNWIIVNDHLPLIYQHDVQGTKQPNSIFLFIQKYRYVHFWDNNIHYILHHFMACHCTIDMSIFICIVRNIIWDRIRFRKNILVYLNYPFARTDTV